MFDAIKQITDDNFFFQEDSAQVHYAHNTVQLSEKCGFRVSPFCQVVQKQSYLWWHSKASLDCLLYRQHFCQKIWKSIHVCQSYSKPNVGRFLRHGVDHEDWSTPHLHNSPFYPTPKILCFTMLFNHPDTQSAPSCGGMYPMYTFPGPT